MERVRGDQTHNTTKTKRREEDTIYDKGEACAAFPATAAGDLTGRFRDNCLFLGQTHLRGVSAGNFAFSALCIPCYATLAVVLFLTATCTDLLKAGESVGGRSLAGIMIVVHWRGVLVFLWLGQCS